MPNRLKLSLILFLLAGGGIWGVLQSNANKADFKFQNGTSGGSQTIDDKISQIQNEQTAYFQTNGKYQQYLETANGSITTDVTEYVGPKGAGYQITTKEKTATSTIIKSVGFGPEDRTFEIVLPNRENLATTTTTNL